MKLKNTEGYTLREDRRALRRRYRFPYLMLAPFAVFTVLFVVAPIIIMLVMSFTNMDMKMKWDFVGFKNYTKIFGYPDMGKIVLRTFLLVAIDVVFNVLGSIFVCIITTYYLDYYDLELAEAAVNDWVASTAHLENILNPDVDSIGVGIAMGKNDKGDKTWYCVQLFLVEGCEVNWVDDPITK